jgi:hypothetical protein
VAPLVKPALRPRGSRSGGSVLAAG